MKKSLYILLLLTVAATGCEKQESASYPKHLIRGYSEGEYELKYSDILLRVVLNGQGRRYYHSPDAVLPADERYLELARRNGDTCFYQPTYSLWYMDRGAWADNFRSLSIVSDADWDESHPAGTPLDDLFEVSFAVYGPYIRNGYVYIGDPAFSLYCYTSISKRMDLLEPQDMEVIHDRGPALFIRSYPTRAREHTLTLTITTTDGKVHTPSITCIPKPYDPQTNDR